MSSPVTSPLISPSAIDMSRFEEMQRQVKALDYELKLQKSKNDEMQVQMKVMRSEIDEKRAGIERAEGQYQQALKEVNNSVKAKGEAQTQCGILKDEIEYLKLREKKVMYLIYVLQNRGYPVNQVFEQEVKHIPTSRF